MGDKIRVHKLIYQKNPIDPMSVIGETTPSNWNRQRFIVVTPRKAPKPGTPAAPVSGSWPGEWMVSMAM